MGQRPRMVGTPSVGRRRSHWCRIMWATQRQASKLIPHMLLPNLLLADCPCDRVHLATRAAILRPSVAAKVTQRHNSVS